MFKPLCVEREREREREKGYEICYENRYVREIRMERNFI